MVLDRSVELAALIRSWKAQSRPVAGDEIEHGSKISTIRKSPQRSCAVYRRPGKQSPMKQEQYALSNPLPPTRPNLWPLPQISIWTRVVNSPSDSLIEPREMHT